MLRATFRERRGVVTLLAMPPVVGFAMMDYFARPRPHKNKEPIYKEGHTTWRQGTSKGGAYHFIEFSYDEQDHTPSGRSTSATSTTKRALMRHVW